MERLPHHPAIFFALATLALAAGCARTPAPSAPPAAARSLPVPAAYYQGLKQAGQPVLAIDSTRSLIVATVRRAGPFAKLGHDHTVASHHVTGFVAPAAGRADLVFRLDEMQIDEPDLRAAAGLDQRQPDADAITGTRHNMLGPVLQADQHPYVQIRVDRIDAAQVRLTLALHGRTRVLALPVRVHAGDPMTVEGAFTLRQTDFGIQPFTVLGGALAVQDEIGLRYRLVARGMN
jgi:hypothetical protein